MRKSLVLALLLAAAPAAALADQAQPAQRAGSGRSIATAAQGVLGAAQLDQIIADFEAYERRENPIDAAQEGDRAALARLPELSPAAERRRQAALQTFKTRLAAVSPRVLDPEAAFNHAFLSRIVDRRLEAFAFDDSRFAFDSEGGAGTLLGYLSRTTPVTSRADADAWIARLEAVGRLYAESQANAKRGIDTRFTQPRSVVESAIKVAEAEAALPLDQDPLLIPLAKMPASISAADQTALRQRARAVITRDVQPARREWLRFLREDYLPRARPGLGVGSLDGGRPYYAFLARHYTTTDLTPDEIHEVGRSEVARIRAAMQTVMAEAGFRGTFAEFLAFLRSDPQFYAQSREDLMEKASEIAKRADDGLPKLFWTLPRLPYGVRPVPREIEDQYTTGRYSSGSQALGIAGGYLVNTGKLDQRPLYELPALTVHEAVPGHHLQIALAQELGEQPWFRRNASVTAFTEGWGLYSEFLGEEMGIYRTPYERFGRLSYEMWRACRLVADTGMHWKGWTVEQARSCFRDNSALAPHNIETELQRYIGWPGQALAYKIGELKLKELRADAERALGDRFDVRRYHDAVLLGGALPLDLLEQRVDAWVAEQQRTANQAPAR